MNEAERIICSLVKPREVERVAYERSAARQNHFTAVDSDKGMTFIFDDGSSITIDGCYVFINREG